MEKEQIIKEVLEEEFEERYKFYNKKIKDINRAWWIPYMNNDKSLMPILKKALQKQEDKILEMIDECKSKINIGNANSVFIDGKKLSKESGNVLAKTIMDKWIDKEELKQKIKTEPNKAQDR